MTDKSYGPKSKDPLRVLFVDDEPLVLSALSRNVRDYFDATYVEGGQAAIDLLNSDIEPFAVVCTDMRMPEVDGVQVLKAFHEHAPDTTRLLLTGQSDINSAMAAVNEGNIFRFLLKPTSLEDLKKTVIVAAELNALHKSEQQLLQQTLTGSVQALLDTLALANPLVFSRSVRIGQTVTVMAELMELENVWEMEVAAALSNLGAVTLPLQLSERLSRGAPLDRSELRMMDELPPLVDRLLAGIPRLDRVREIIREQTRWQSTDVPIETKLLVFASEFDALGSRHLTNEVISNIVLGRAKEFGPAIISAFSRMMALAPEAPAIIRVKPENLKTGMKLAEDVRTSDGLLLVGNGQIITESLLIRIANFTKSIGLEEDLLPVFETVD